MSGRAVAIRRRSGKANAELICGLVKDAVPDTLFSYEQIAQILQADTDTVYKPPAICGAVRQANKRLLREHKRELRNVRSTGFRLVPAKEHVELAQQRNGKAERQYRRGLLTLQHVRWDEMDANQRAAHEGTLLVMSGVMAAVNLVHQRQNRQDALIAGLVKRLDRPA